MRIRGAAALLGIFVALAWLGGCLDSIAPPPRVETVAISPFTATITVGDTLRLTATPRDALGSALPGRPVVWASDSPQVATVSLDGLVTGMGDGTVNITATSEGARGQALVTVGGPPPPSPQLIVSNAVRQPVASLSSALRGLNASRDAASDSVAFVSLTPGAAPSGVTATVQSPATSQSLTAVMSNGGFDPVAIGAGVGDSLLIVARDDHGAAVLEAQMVVAAARRPIVVRTDPPPRKRDVPLNAAIVIVFSEPVDEATLTSSSVLLLQGSTSIAGAVRLVDAAGLTGVFEPAGRLASNTDYRLVVTSAVRDLSGSALEAPVATDFTTGAALVGAPASVTVSPAVIEGFFPLTALIRAYVQDAQGNVLVGSAVQWTSSDSSIATVTPSGGPASETSGSEARLTLLAGGVATITATSEGLSDTAVARSHPFPGSLRVTTVTTGADVDTNGYSVDLRGNGQGVPVNGSFTYSGVPPGDYSIELRDVASNCAVSGPNPQTVTVVSSDTAVAAFTVTCTALTGDLQVSVATTGGDLDPDGYMLRVDNRSPVPVTLNGTVTIEGLIGGEHAVALEGLALNCGEAGGNPRTVSVTTGGLTRDTARTSFDVACVVAPRLAFGMNSNPSGSPDLYVAKANGTGLARLTTDGFDFDPTWAPDGTKIAFVSGNFDIYVMNADGSNRVQITSGDVIDLRPAWSPDGARIAFARNQCTIVDGHYVCDGNWDIYVMDADGSGPVGLTSDPAQDFAPAWSPDGTRIAFYSERGGVGGIHVMNADGSGVVRLTSDGGREPAWSPDGAMIAFERWSDIYVMNADGAGVTQLTAGHAEIEPAWSPDGRWIAFMAFAPCDYFGCYADPAAIKAVRPDGTGLVEIIPIGVSGAPFGVNGRPAWRPGPP